MREAMVHVPDELLEVFGIGEFVSLVRDVGLNRVTELQCQRPGCLLIIDVDEPIQSDSLSSLDTIEWWEQIDGDSGVTYLCKLTVPALGEELEPHHETSVSEDISITDDGFELRIVGPHDDISDRVAEYEQSSVGVVLRSLGHYDGADEPLDALTDRQRDVLQTAFDLGYFSVPRDVTTEEIAAELGLTPSTVREHLQRAQHNLLTELLGASQ